MRRAKTPAMLAISVKEEGVVIALGTGAEPAFNPEEVMEHWLVQEFIQDIASAGGAPVHLIDMGTAENIGKVVSDASPENSGPERPAEPQ